MYGMNENQNVYMEGKRTTSRVTNEPGGKSSVQLGWDAPSSTKTKEPKKDNETKEKENNFSMQVVGSTKPSVARIAQEKFDRPDDDEGKPAKGRGVSSNAYASGNSQNTGNVITDRPSSRVTQPPGGKSSISFY